MIPVHAPEEEVFAVERLTQSIRSMRRSELAFAEERGFAVELESEPTEAVSPTSTSPLEVEALAKHAASQLAHDPDSSVLRLDGSGRDGAAALLE